MNQLQNTKNWNEAIVIGPGRVGLGLSYYLAKNWGKVSLLGRGRSCMHSGTWKVYDGTFTEDLDTIDYDSINHPKVIFLAVKSFDISRTITDHLEVFHRFPSTRIISLANGMLVTLFEELRKAYPSLPLEFGTTTIATMLDSKKQLVYLSNSRPEVRLQKKLNFWPQDDFTAGNLSVLTVDNITYHHVKKWAYNVLINVFSAYKNLAKNGELLLFEPDLRALSTELAAYILEHFSFEVSSDNLLSEAMQLIRNTSENVNSLVFDIKNKKNNELEYLILKFNFAKFPLLRNLQRVFSVL